MSKSKIFGSICSRKAIALIAVSATAACSTIQSGGLSTTDEVPATGLVYYLPIRMLTVDAKFTIQDCGIGADKAALKYDLAPTVTSTIEADRSHPYVISRGLDGKVLKALNYEITQYENGTLKGVNVVADDRTAETATSILSGLAKFGLGATGLGFFSGDKNVEEIVWLSSIDSSKPGTDADIARIRSVCGSPVVDALLAIQKLRAGTSGAREAAETKVKAAAAVTEAEKAVAEARANLKAANDAKGAEDIAEASKVLAAAVKTLVDARNGAQGLAAGRSTSAIGQDIAAIVQKSLTFSASSQIVPSEQSPFLQRLDFPMSALKAAGIRGATDDFHAMVSIKPVAVPPLNPEIPVEYTPTPHPGGAADGLWFRTPASASLQICLEACNPASIRLSQTLSVPQWGQLTRLPLKNRVFAKNTTKLAFAPDGALTSFGSESSSAAERAGQAFQEAGGTFLDFVTQRRALIAELAAAESAAEKAAIQQQLDLLDLNQQLAAAQSQVGPERQSQLDLLQYQIDQTQKQIELLELQAELAELQAASEQ